MLYRNTFRLDRPANRNFLPAVMIFIIFNGGFLIMKERLISWGFDQAVLVLGNILIFFVSLLSYWMGVKGFTTKNSHAFFRWVYGSIMIKLILLSIAAFIYIMSMKKDVNKPGLFFCMGLYVVYTAIEISALMKLNKQKTNA